jgi:predicted NBD/HSP70 family sugar kinase
VGNSKLNSCLAEAKRKSALAARPLPKDGSGRKPLSFSLSPDLGLFLGINCSIEADYFVLVDASGRTVAERSYPAESWEAEAVAALIDNLAEFLEEHPRTKDSILAVGLSAAVRFNRPGSAVWRSPSFTNDALLPLIGSLEKLVGAPVYNGRPQVLLCYQGDLRNLIARKESFINIITTDNVGIAIFVNGESWLGQSGLSGDFGHLKIPGNELPCYCGASGCLRTKLSYMGICQETRRRLVELESSGGHVRLDAADFEGPDYTVGVEKLIAAANGHDALATGIVYDAATELGRALATVVSLFNPARLVVHSVLTEARDVFTEQVRTMIRKNCLEL